jgi:hypothetical protein
MDMEVFIVDTIENVGENWLVADFGLDTETNKNIILTTNRVHASELNKYSKGAREDAQLVADLLNKHYGG